MAVKVKNVVIGEGRPKICVPLTPKEKKELKEQLEKIEKTLEEAGPACVDLLEWRADFWEDKKDSYRQAAELIREKFPQLPLLFTFRSKKEGGERKISGEEYQWLYTMAIEENIADMLDVELFSEGKAMEKIVERAKKAQKILVFSSHDFQKTPSEKEMEERLLLMDRQGADILKLAVMPREETDVLRLLWVTQKMKGLTQKPVITMSMGSLGTVSRAAGGVFGSAVTFGCVGKASAPGQIEARKLRELLEIF